MEPITPVTQEPARPLRRSAEHRMIAGVAGGLAEYFDFDVPLVRVGLVVLACMGVGIPLYVAAWLFVPEEGTGETVADELLTHIGSHHHSGAQPTS